MRPISPRSIWQRKCLGLGCGSDSYWGGTKTTQSHANLLSSSKNRICHENIFENVAPWIESYSWVTGMW